MKVDFSKVIELSHDMIPSAPTADVKPFDHSPEAAPFDPDHTKEEHFRLMAQTYDVSVMGERGEPHPEGSWYISGEVFFWTHCGTHVEFPYHNRKDGLQAQSYPIENLIGNAGHIQKILGIFEENNKLGVLVPPAPVGKVFKVWYGFGWRNCFNTVKELASKLGLNCDLDEAKPPITIGTTFWFRREALKKLFDYTWKYDDFDDIKLVDNQYLSFAVERIFAYVAQDAGYTTGEVMTVEYAKKQTLFLQYSLSEIFRKMHDFYPFPTYENALHIDDNLQHLQQYALNKDEIFLFGTDDVGKFCAGYLRKIGHEPKGFIVSGRIDNDAIDYIPVFSIEECSQCGSNKGIIITAATRKAQNEMVNELEKYQIEDYCIFLQEAR